MATLDQPLGGAPGIRRLGALGRSVGRLSVPRSLVLGLTLLLLGGLGVLQVLQTSQVATLGYELSALDYERSQLQAEIRQLRVAVAEQGTLEAARERTALGLGMSEVEPAFTVSVGERAPAALKAPRRYVEPAPTATTELRTSAWWERVLAQLLGSQ